MGFDLQDSLSKWPGPIWAKYQPEKHALGYSFLGPSTRIDLRIPGYQDKLQLNDGKLMTSEYIDNTFIPRSEDTFVNEIDRIAMRHDLRYAESENLQMKHEADRLMLEELSKVQPNTFGEKITKWITYRIIKLKEKLGLGLPSEYAKVIAQELHAPIHKKYPRRKIITNFKDEIFSIDLAEMVSVREAHAAQGQDISSASGLASPTADYKFILIVIDNWSKYLWCIPLKSKSGETVSEAFKTLFQTTNRIPKMVHSDKGKEFYNSKVKQIFDKLNVELYSTQNETKSAIAERMIRTLKEKIEPRLTQQELEGKNKSWLSILPEVVREYNTSIHKTIKMTPLDASKEESQQELRQLYHELYSKRVRDKNILNVGTPVRIYKWKNKFEKSSKQRWTDEVFIINRVLPTNPICYKITDITGKEEIIGSFYREELLASREQSSKII